jgi:hypothetical protein
VCFNLGFEAREEGCRTLGGPLRNPARFGVGRMPERARCLEPRFYDGGGRSRAGDALPATNSLRVPMQVADIDERVTGCDSGRAQLIEVPVEEVTMRCGVWRVLKRQITLTAIAKAFGTAFLIAEAVAIVRANSSS